MVILKKENQEKNVLVLAYERLNNVFDQYDWTQPIVIGEDNEIVDGFHRWTVSQDKEIYAMTDGLIPVVQLKNIDRDHQMASTIRHNKARGNHNVLSMADIVVQLKDDMNVPDEDSFNKGWKPKE